MNLFYIRNIGTLFLAEMIIEQYQLQNNLALIHENLLGYQSNNIAERINSKLWNQVLLEPKSNRVVNLSNFFNRYFLKYFKHIRMISFYKHIFNEFDFDSIFLPYANRKLDEEVLYFIARSKNIKINKYDEVVPIQESYNQLTVKDSYFNSLLNYLYYSRFLYTKTLKKVFIFDTHYTLFKDLVKSNSFQYEKPLIPKKLGQLSSDLILYFSSTNLDPFILTLDKEKTLIEALLELNPGKNIIAKFHNAESNEKIQMISGIVGVSILPPHLNSLSGEEIIYYLNPGYVIGFYSSVIYFSTLLDTNVISLINFLNVDKVESRFLTLSKSISSIYKPEKTSELKLNLIPGKTE